MYVKPRYLKKLIDKHFSVCIEGFRYTFSWKHFLMDSDVFISIGYSEKTKRSHRPQSSNVPIVKRTVNFKNLWFFVNYDLYRINYSNENVDIVDENESYLREIIQKRMKFRFLNNGSLGEKISSFNIAKKIHAV
jgi:hypothetical protein